jgi:hypothetical protein
MNRSVGRSLVAVLLALAFMLGGYGVVSAASGTWAATMSVPNQWYWAGGGYICTDGAPNDITLSQGTGGVTGHMVYKFSSYSWVADFQAPTSGVWMGSLPADTCGTISILVKRYSSGTPVYSGGTWSVS